MLTNPGACDSRTVRWTRVPGLQTFFLRFRISESSTVHRVHTHGSGFCTEIVPGLLYLPNPHHRKRECRKTTILQRVCNAREKPDIYDSAGEKIDPTILIASREHDVKNEMVFRNNPGFIFRSSR
ncbi:hypothetical protein BDR03DRAFT_1096473 [Suillus americanus]|nr:hypothetical protein BDR03DRAFT_1096473 [Suillus americanus]